MEAADLQARTRTVGLGTPTLSVELRPVAPSDEPFLRALYRSTRDAELAQVPWSEEQKAAFANQQFDMQDRWYRQQYAGARFLVIERASEPIGRLYLHKGSEDVRVMDLTLVPSARNQGIGTSLLREVIADAEGQGLAVTLHVETFNPVRRLYERLGFRQTSVEGIYVAMRRDVGGPTGG